MTTTTTASVNGARQRRQRRQLRCLPPVEPQSISMHEREICHRKKILVFVIRQNKTKQEETKNKKHNSKHKKKKKKKQRPTAWWGGRHGPESVSEPQPEPGYVSDFHCDCDFNSDSGTDSEFGLCVCPPTKLTLEMSKSCCCHIHMI